jgi:hypothetical protein
MFSDSPVVGPLSQRFYSDSKSDTATKCDNGNDKEDLYEIGGLFWHREPPATRLVLFRL